MPGPANVMRGRATIPFASAHGRRGLASDVESDQGAAKATLRGPLITDFIGSKLVNKQDQGLFRHSTEHRRSDRGRYPFPTDRRVNATGINIWSISWQ